VNADLALKFPKLYTPGLRSTLFNKLEFTKSALQGIASSFFLFFISYGKYSFLGQGLFLLFLNIFIKN
jgi:hypothetical protein